MHKDEQVPVANEEAATESEPRAVEPVGTSEPSGAVPVDAEEGTLQPVGGGAPEPSAEGGAAVELVEPRESPEQQIEQLNAEMGSLQDLLRRKQAEFENYRKRIERERQEVASYATAELIRQLLPVLDNLERAIEAGESGGDSRLLEGVVITHRQFQDILEKNGLQEIEALGHSFDPQLHEAVGRTETTEHDEGRVLDVYQRGYLLRGRLLRPALVNVAQRPTPVAGGGGEGEELIESRDRAAPPDAEAGS